MPAFAVVSLFLLSITVYLVYLMFTEAFLVGKVGRRLILLSLIIASAGFLITMMVYRVTDGPFIRWSYIIFSLGLGLLFYLTISAILFTIAKLIKIKTSKALLARIGIALAVALFIIGLFAAAYPRVKNISVQMAGLPADWQGKKIVQLSDLHLGGIYGPKFLKQQVAKVNSLNPDLIVITGDLFDGTKNDLAPFEPELAKLKAKNGVIFVPGNHDNYLGIDKVESLLQGTNILVLRDQAITINGLEIIGADVHEMTNNNDDLSINNLDSYHGQARLLLKHVPANIWWAKKMNVDLQLSGHSHNGQMFPLSMLTYLFYGKYQYGLHTEGNFNIYTSSGLGSWGSPVRTFNQAEIVAITIN